MEKVISQRSALNGFILYVDLWYNSCRKIHLKRQMWTFHYYNVLESCTVVLQMKCEKQKSQKSSRKRELTKYSKKKTRSWETQFDARNYLCLWWLYLSAAFTIQRQFCCICCWHSLHEEVVFIDLWGDLK